MYIYFNCGVSTETQCFAEVCRKGGKFTVLKQNLQQKIHKLQIAYIAEPLREELRHYFFFST
jgi:hypothetical protein